jgi:carboxymethylenebutenolidase
LPIALGFVSVAPLEETAMKDIQTRTLQLTSPKAKEKFASAEFSVFEARPPEGTALKGGVIIVQEIFGLTAHIRSVAEGYAKRGFIAWAPAYFDHEAKGIELNLDDAGMTKGRAITTKMGWDIPVEDTEIAAKALKELLSKSGGSKKVSVIGYCWGGSVAWFMSTRKPSADGDSVDKCVGYYGSAVLTNKTETPKIPIILHFGEVDKHIPLDGVKEFAKTHPTVPVYTYNADHGFNRDGSNSYNPEAAALAPKRTLEFIEK